MTIKSITVIAAVALAMATWAASALGRGDALTAARAGTAPFHNLHKALAADHAELRDAQADASAARVRSAAAPIKWTASQLEQLADAYSARNPGWRPPVGSGLPGPPVSAAQITWTSENLDALANAYAALNPAWIRPAL
jgi:hypothetical protein